MTRVALVTGASRGIGAAISARLADDGYQVIVNGRDRDAAEQQAEWIGGRATAFDVSDPSAVAEAIEPLETVDVLVNNAGSEDMFDYLTDTTPARWRRMIAVNLEGVMACAHAVLPGMQRARYGRIVNIGSEAGRIGSHGNAGYAAAKGGVLRRVVREHYWMDAERRIAGA